MPEFHGAHGVVMILMSPEEARNLASFIKKYALTPFGYDANADLIETAANNADKKRDHR